MVGVWPSETGDLDIAAGKTVESKSLKSFGDTKKNFLRFGSVCRSFTTVASSSQGMLESWTQSS